MDNETYKKYMEFCDEIGVEEGDRSLHILRHLINDYWPDEDVFKILHHQFDVYQDGDYKVYYIGWIDGHDCAFKITDWHQND